MTELGYALSSEEHSPNDLVRNARMAEEAGFTFTFISDHYHPWVTRQGHSPFVWSILGGIAHATEKIRVGTGVTCPTVRIHPAIIAQAAATTASMMPGRFILGVGSGENLNEHILGDHWPPADIRLEMLAEAVQIIRMLLEGEEASKWGNYYIVENARVFDVPKEKPPVYVAAVGETALQLAGRIGDGLVSTAPKEDVVEKFEAAGGRGKPKVGQAKVCYAPTVEEGRKIAYEWWPNTALPGSMHADLPSTDHFDDAVKLVTEDMVAKEVVCGPDKNEHLEQLHKLVDAGYDMIYIHQIGPDQKGFFEFYEREILPEWRK